MSDKFHPHKIFKYCPKCSKESLVVINAKAQECNSCGFLFYTNSAAAVAGIIENEKGEILLTRRAFEPAIGMLDLPGGFVDPLESAEEALVREIKEELNIDVVSYTYFGSFPNSYVFKDLLYYTMDMVFICKVHNFENIIAADDIDAFEFVSPSDEIIQNIGLESIKRVIKAYMQKN